VRVVLALDVRVKLLGDYVVFEHLRHADHLKRLGEFVSLLLDDEIFLIIFGFHKDYLSRSSPILVPVLRVGCLVESIENERRVGVRLLSE
jgi:hypothetical protein